MDFNESSRPQESQSQDIYNASSTIPHATSSKVIVASVCTAALEDHSATVKQPASTQGAKLESPQPHVCYVVNNADPFAFENLLISTKGLEHETEGQGLLTTDADDVHEYVTSAADIGETRSLDRPHLQQGSGVQDSILPRRLQIRLPRVRSAMELGRNRAFFESIHIDSDDCHQSDLETTILNDSFKNSEYQNDGSRAGLRSPEKAPETDIRFTPPHENAKPKEHKSSDCASTKSRDNRTWEQLVTVLEESREREMIDLREDIAALNEQYQQDVDAANSKKLVLQKRVKKLLEQKVACETDLEAKNATIEQAVAASRYYQDNYDRIKKEYALLSATILRDRFLPSSSSANDLQQENTRLCNLVASLSSENERLNSMLQDTHTHNKSLEDQVTQSLESNRVLGKHLQKCYKDAELYIQRMHHLNNALNQEPGKYADVDREIKLRDQRYTDLELRAGECFTALIQLEKKSTEDQEAACAEVADLKTRLEKQETDIASLKASKVTFQRHSEEVYDMLASRILPSTLFDAMNEYFQLVINDNDILKAKIEDQILEICLEKEKIKLLSLENQSHEQIIVGPGNPG